MNSPEEKAKELVDKFMPLCYVPWMGGKDEATQEECAKESAIICVDEIIAVIKPIMMTGEKLEYWGKVKDCILKL